VGELRYPVGGAFDPQLFHSVSQRIRMHTESLSRRLRPLSLREFVVTRWRCDPVQLRQESQGQEVAQWG
jgi:hypothetical protein